MAKNSDEKRHMILEAAKRRFAHYGMAKTTMAEIAKDLSYSKALLYYYFPDKNSLYGAVLEHIIEEFDEEFTPYFNDAPTSEEALMRLLEMRILFIKRYYYVVEFTLFSLKDLPKELETIIVQSHEVYLSTIRKILQRGIDTGEFEAFDVDEYAKIFFFSSLGMRMVAMKDLETNFIPSKEDFDNILSMQHKLTKVFVKGISK